MDHLLLHLLLLPPPVPCTSPLSLFWRLKGTAPWSDRSAIITTLYASSSFSWSDRTLFPPDLAAFARETSCLFSPFFRPPPHWSPLGSISLYLSLPCFFLSLSHQYTTVLFSSNEVNLPSLLSPLFLQVGLGSPTWPPPLAIAHRRRYHQWGEAFVRSKHWRPSLSVLCTFPPSNALHPPEKKTVSLLSIDGDLFLQSCAAAADGGGGWLVGTMAASVSISLPLIRSRMFSWKMTAFCFLACVKDFFFSFFFLPWRLWVWEREPAMDFGEKNLPL